MSVQPPFLYDKASSYTFDGPIRSSFNPKAVTNASWEPKAPRPKQDGPLISFNRHPDSYHQSPYGNVTYTPMNPNTRKRVQTAWKIQRALRLLALFGALVAVFCIIVLRKTTSIVGWIVRIGPAVALFHTLYATYFLCRSINSRAPASCASYQMFAGLIDSVLIPIFGLSCYMATMDYTTNAYGWGTIFDDNATDYKIIEMFMIVCGIEGGLFVLSLILDFYLAVIYRKVAKLPVDMNPLEEKARDNLTGAGRAHKRNKSELVYEKHMSSSTVASERFSQMNDPAAQNRRIPFKHTRTDSADRDSLTMKKDVLGDLSRPSSAMTPAANARPAGAGLDHKPARSSNLVHQRSTLFRPNSWLSYSNYEGVPAELSDVAEYNLTQEVRSMSPVSAVSDHPYTNHIEHDRYHHGSRPVSPDKENCIPPPYNHNLGPPRPLTPPRKRSREPLGMNPPTPVHQQFDSSPVRPAIESSLVPRPLSMASTNNRHMTPPRQALREAENFATPSSRPASFVGSGTKSRFYGNLRSSVGGSPTRNPNDEDEDGFEAVDFGIRRNDTVKTAQTASSANFEVYASDSDAGHNDDDDDYDPYRRVSPGPQPEPMQHGTPVLISGSNGVNSPVRQWNAEESRHASSQRQVSRTTGNDLQAGYAGLDPEFGRGMARRREVSGKVAEEGRAYEYEPPLPTPSLAPVQGMKPGAAGWARFKGL